MTNKTNQTKSKRLSPSWRKHVRRLKQAARKTGTAYTPAGQLYPYLDHPNCPDRIDGRHADRVGDLGLSSPA